MESKGEGSRALFCVSNVLNVLKAKKPVGSKTDNAGSNMKEVGIDSHTDTVPFYGTPRMKLQLQLQVQL